MVFIDKTIKGLTKIKNFSNKLGLGNKLKNTRKYISENKEKIYLLGVPVMFIGSVTVFSEDVKDNIFGCLFFIIPGSIFWPIATGCGIGYFIIKTYVNLIERLKGRN